uniref:LOW QUALITY PROTEIN: pentatricopeptide repeat-containing protein At4g33170-like n=1 Tax=Erigeron canadensis TaxID=72917 RepID=UPI001CB8ECDD|nr:LOW QUALITY PROTEIN: pentatricopeptide repeat-containing protein At4g33170-like [Erigeron canadensis]
MTMFLRSFCSSIASYNSCSRSPWFPLIRTAIVQNDLLLGKATHAVAIKHRNTTADRFLTNNLISMYSKCSSLSSSRHLFNVTQHKDHVTWNSILAAYAFNCDLQTGIVEEGLHLFRLLLRSCDFNKLTKLTFAPVLKLCLMSGYVCISECVHGYTVKLGLESEVLVSGALVNIYIRYGKIREARLTFDNLAEYNRDEVLWNVMLRAYVKTGLQEEAFHFLSDFHRCEDVNLDIDSVHCVFSAFANDACTNMKNIEQVQAYAIKLSLIDNEFAKVVSPNKTISQFYKSLDSVMPLGELNLGEKIHGIALKSGCDIDIDVSNRLIDMYTKMGCFKSAKRVFFEMKNTDIVSWNSIIRTYKQSGSGEESVDLYMDMLCNGLQPDHFTFAGVLSTCTALPAGLYLTEQIHVHALKSGFDIDISVSTTLVNSYSTNGGIKQAESLFLDIDEFDLGLWNTMIFAFINSGNSYRAWELFIMMQRVGYRPDEITLATMTRDCRLLKSLNLGSQVHGYVLKFGVDQDLYLSSSLLDMYIKCGYMVDADRVFQEIASPDVAAWTSMISGWVENGDENRALVIYQKMRKSGVLPDVYTFATLIKASSYSTAFELGRQIHANAIKSNCALDAYVITSLIDFYAKCGNIQDSFRVFRRTHVKDIVIWNAMLVGLAQYGHGKDALDLFKYLISNGNILPDRVTFIGVLLACGHSGLISEAYSYFESMVIDYGIEADTEHYWCLIDCLCRAGYVQEAEKLINFMPLETCGSMYKSVISACRFQGDIETGKRVATKILKLEPFDSSTYVLLSNIYASCNQWSEMAHARKNMKRKNVKKDPGFSRIDVKTNTLSFVVDDRLHPQREMIYDEVEHLINMIKDDEYIEDTDSICVA